MDAIPTTDCPVVPPAPGESAYRGPCRVLGAHITRVTRGGTVLIICGEYCETEASCRLKKAALESETRCVMLRA